MSRLFGGLSAILLVCGLALLWPTATTEVIARQTCPSCPAGAVCGCINCGPCNSGSFSVMCVCWPTPGKVLCSASNGDCALGQCATCTSRDQTQTCTTKVGCTGMTCVGPPQCIPTGAALFSSTKPCRDCVVTTLASRTTPRKIVAQAPEVPIEVLSYNLPSDKGPAYFEIRNKSSRGLVTLLLAATYATSNGETQTVYHEADSWDRDQSFVGPKGMKHLPLTSTVQHPAGIASITLRPVYAEFDDGSKYGEAVADVVPCQTQRREQILEAYATAVAKFRQSGKSPLVMKKLIDEVPELGWLAVRLPFVGADGVEELLSKPRKLKP